MIRRCLQQNVETLEHIEAAEDGSLNGHLQEQPLNDRLWLQQVVENLRNGHPRGLVLRALDLYPSPCCVEFGQWRVW